MFDEMLLMNASWLVMLATVKRSTCTSLPFMCEYVYVRMRMRESLHEYIP